VRAVLCAVAAVLVLGCGSAGAETRRLHVLFVGNSLTATNDLPGMVAAFARAVGRVQIDGASYAPGGYALEDHWTDGTARALLDRGGWDAVVMQQGPSSLPESGRNLTQWTKVWADEARAHGARPALLTVWPERYRVAFFPAVIAHHREAARAAGAASFPAGVAWRFGLQQSPPLALYGPDQFHPSRLGTYLTAVAVYTGLTGDLPRTLPRDVGAAHVGSAGARRVRAAVALAYASR
jgi:hypothetical protein